MNGCRHAAKLLQQQQPGHWSYLVVAKHERVESKEALLEPRRGHLGDLVVVQDQRLQLPELREDGRGDAPDAVARGVENLQVPQRPHAVQSFAGKLVSGGGEIRDLSSVEGKFGNNRMIK